MHCFPSSVNALCMVYHLDLSSPKPQPLQALLEMAHSAECSNEGGHNPHRYRPRKLAVFLLKSCQKGTFPIEVLHIKS